MTELPERIHHAVEITAEGLKFRKRARSVGALVGFTGFGFVMGLVLIVPSVLLLIFNPGCCIFIVVGIVLMVVAPLLGTRITTEVTVEVTHEGIRELGFGGAAITWPHVDQVRLRGDVDPRTAVLQANEMVLYQWTGLKASSEGWDVSSVRAFAQRVAELGGQTLVDELPALEDFEAREAERYAKALELRQAKRDREQTQNRERFPDAHATEPEPAEWIPDDDGEIAVLDKGQRPRLLATTSTNQERPVRLLDGALCVGDRRTKLDAIEAVFVSFQKQQDGIDALLTVDLRTGGRWVVARRRLAGAGQLLGLATELRSLIHHL